MVNWHWRFQSLTRDENRFARFMLVAGCVLLVGALIFRDFLFGGSVLLYTDVGRDSLDDYYPWFVHFSDYLRHYGFPSWSFSVGIGQDILYLAGYLFWEPVIWLRRELIAHALIYQHLGKVLATGLIYFAFLRLQRIEFAAAVLGSLLLAFSAYMCMGACWFVLADEVVGFTAVLLAVEWALQRGYWGWLSLAVAAIGLISAFHLYLCALLLCFYVPAKLWSAEGHWRTKLPKLFAIAGAAALGVGISALIALPNLLTMLHSPRGSGIATAAVTLGAFPIFGLESRAHYVTAILRFLGNDLLGVGDRYHGWQNYFEAPIIYCGLVSVLLVPQALVVSKNRVRIICGLFLVAAMLPMVLPWFRYLFWGFQGDYYRTYCLFIVIGVIAMAMMVLSHFKQGRPINLWLLAATAIAAIAILHLPEARDKSLIRNTTLFLVGSAALLAAGQLFRRQKMATWGLVFLAAIELVRFDFVTVSDRDKITARELQQRVGYNDDTVDAVRDIKGSDPSFFRVTKLQAAYPVSYGFNDAMVFGYYGTAAYSSFNNRAYIDFLLGVGAIPEKSEADTRWCPGVTNDPLLSILMGEKYALVEDAALLRDSTLYEFVRHYQHQYLFRNVAWVPLGLIFDRYIPEDAFLKLPARKKSSALLRAITLKRDQAEQLNLPELPLADAENEITDGSINEVVLSLRNSAFELTSFRPSEIVGKVHLARKAVMVVQTPFDEGWRAFEDGRAVTVLPVDIGLLGVALDSGEHRVILHYQNRFLSIGAIITVASLLCLGLGIHRWPRLTGTG